MVFPRHTNKPESSSHVRHKHRATQYKMQLYYYTCVNMNVSFIIAEGDESDDGTFHISSVNKNIIPGLCDVIKVLKYVQF